MIPKRFFSSVFTVCGPVAYRLSMVLCTLALLCCPATTANAEELDSPIPPNQMEKPLEKSLSSHNAELEELKSHRKRLEDLREKIQAETEILRSLYIVHAQLLLESKPRIDTFENAISENRFALGVLDEHIGDIEEPMKSISDFNRQTTDRIETVQGQIEEIRDSRLPAPRKEFLEDTALEVLGILEENKQLCEQIKGE